MEPFISICIPAYSRVHYLKRLLDSIRIQQFSDYEIVLSDDTQDGTVEQIIEEYKDLNIQYARNSPAEGTPGNWNAAIKKAKGHWIKLMHDDDWFATPHALQNFADAARMNDTDFIFCACTYVSREGKKNSTLSETKFKEIKSDPLSLIFENKIGHPSVVMHRKDDSILYDTKYKWLVDIDFYIRYLNKHPKLYYIDQFLINIGVGETQVSAECYKNPDVEIPEYLSLISDVTRDRTEINKHVFFAIWTLIKKFRINNIEQLKGNYNGVVETAIDYIISYQSKIPRLVLKQTPATTYFMNKAWKKYSNS